MIGLREIRFDDVKKYDRTHVFFVDTKKGTVTSLEDFLMNVYVVADCEPEAIIEDDYNPSDEFWRM